MSFTSQQLQTLKQYGPHLGNHPKYKAGKKSFAKQHAQWFYQLGTEITRIHFQNEIKWYTKQENLSVFQRGYLAEMNFWDYCDRNGYIYSPMY